MIVILVRHAERQSSGSDPSLTAAGKRRAALLATMFAGAEVTAIFTSGAGRTKQTAAPLAAKVGVAPRQVDDSIAAARVQILAGGAWWWSVTATRSPSSSKRSAGPLMSSSTTTSSTACSC